LTGRIQGFHDTYLRKWSGQTGKPEKSGKLKEKFVKGWIDAWAGGAACLSRLASGVGGFRVLFFSARAWAVAAPSSAANSPTRVKPHPWHDRRNGNGFIGFMETLASNARRSETKSSRTDSTIADTRAMANMNSTNGR
jgi:hypothetical protein